MLGMPSLVNVWTRTALASAMTGEMGKSVSSRSNVIRSACCCWNRMVVDGWCLGVVLGVVR